MKKKPEKFGAEKRIFPRKTLRSQVIFEDESGEGFIYFYSTDISIGGLFLESDIPLKMGTLVFLSFKLTEDSSPLRATGKVVRVERDEAGQTPVGMGVQFVDLPEVQKNQIASFIHS